MSDAAIGVPLIVLAFGISIAYIVKTITENRTKRRLIDEHVSEDTIRALYSAPRRDPDLYGALKWGLVVAGVGIGLVLIELLPITFESPLAYGLLLMFGGGGLLLYYRIMSGRFASPNPEDG